jgi:sulfite reductase (NADPH) flavoprotein alpha-component
MLKICFATMTGNAEALAEETQERANDAGIANELINLMDASADSLTEMSLAVFIVSTWGDGDPPDDAEDFWQSLEANTVDVSGLTYAVLGLGDKDYPEFNGFARKLDNRLTELGATRLCERFEADLDFDDTFAAWSDKVFGLLESGTLSNAK